MISGIIIMIVIILAIIFGCYFGFKKYNNYSKNINDKINKEYDDGNVFMPLDKRDFKDDEYFKEFSKKSEKNYKINNFLNKLDEDFKKFNIL